MGLPAVNAIMSFSLALWHIGLQLLSCQTGVDLGSWTFAEIDCCGGWPCEMFPSTASVSRSMDASETTLSMPTEWLEHRTTTPIEVLRRKPREELTPVEWVEIIYVVPMTEIKQEQKLRERIKAESFREWASLQIVPDGSMEDAVPRTSAAVEDHNLWLVVMSVLSFCAGLAILGLLIGSYLWVSRLTDEAQMLEAKIQKKQDLATVAEARYDDVCRNIGTFNDELSRRDKRISTLELIDKARALKVKSQEQEADALKRQIELKDSTMAAMKDEKPKNLKS